MATQKMMELDPAVIAANDNVRFSLLPDRIEALAGKIADEGRVINAIEVTRLPKDQRNGTEYLVYTGHYRHAAVLALNAKGAGMKIPAVLVEAADDRAAIVKHKVAENVARQDMTPMDISTAMQQLVDAGVPRAEIQNIFPVRGGRRGSVSTQPASPAYVWMHLRFQDLPKTLQNGLHDGSIPVTAGIEFVKLFDKTEGDKEARKEKMNALLVDIDTERGKAIDSDSKENERYLELEAKRVALEQKDAERKAKEDAARDAVKALEQEASVKSEAVVEAYKAQRTAKTADEKKAAKEAHKAKMADSEGTDKKLQSARKELEKLVGPADKPKVPPAVPPSTTRPPVKVSPANPVRPAEVKAAGDRSTGTVTVTPLNLTDLRRALDEAAVETKGYTKTAAIGKAFQSLKNGEIDVKALVAAVAKVVGEKK